MCSDGGTICRYHQLVTDLRCKIDIPITRAGKPEPRYSTQATWISEYQCCHRDIERTIHFHSPAAKDIHSGLPRYVGLATQAFPISVLHARHGRLAKGN